LDLATFLLPNSLGNPYAELSTLSGDPSDFHEHIAYFGTLPFLAGLYELTRATHRRWKLVGAAGVFVSLFIAFGNQTPIFGWLGNLIPGLLLFRCPGRILGAVTPVLALLGAVGFESYLRREKIAGPRQLGVAALAAWVLLAVLLFDANMSLRKVTQYLRDNAESLGFMFLLPAAMLVASLAVLWSARRLQYRFPHAAMAAILAVVSLDLWLSQTRFLRLAEHEPRRLPGNVGPQERFAQIAWFPAVIFNNFRYYRSMDSAFDQRARCLGTNDGGVLPAATERLFASFVSNTNPALATASCRYIDKGRAED
jgi:hypothetical protein